MKESPHSPAPDDAASRKTSVLIVREALPAAGSDVDHTNSDATPPPATLSHYDLLETLGQGGFGVVWKAFDRNLRRIVAVKVMTVEAAALVEARTRFLREARAMAAVRHENVVRVYDVEERPYPFLVMEYIAGETLERRLKRTGPLAAAEAVRLAAQVARGLASAHRRGLIHRGREAGERAARRGAGPGQAVRLRAGPVRRRHHRADGEWGGRRHAGLHVAGTGPRHAARPPVRPVQPRRRPLRHAHRPPPGRGGEYDGGANQGRPGRPPAGPRGPPRRAAVGRRRGGQTHGPEPGRPVRVR